MNKFNQWLRRNGADIIYYCMIFTVVAGFALFGYICGFTDGYTEGYVLTTIGEYIQYPEKQAKNMLTQYKETLESGVVGIVRRTEERVKTQTIPEMDIEYEQYTKYTQHAIENGLKQIPLKILLSFNNDEWKITVVNSLNDIEYKGSEFAAAGTTNRALREIKIKAETDVSQVLIHEFGHYFDTACGRVSEKTDWNKLYNKEWRGIYILNHSFHDVDTPTEYFAEVFYWSVHNPNVIKNVCPESYTAMTKLINEFKQSTVDNSIFSTIPALPPEYTTPIEDNTIADNIAKAPAN